MKTNDTYTFLLVDDNVNNLFALRELIQDAFEAKVLESRSGEETLRILNKGSVDIILMDVRMPGMDGFETARILKSRKKTANIPIIFITAHDPAKTLMEKGFDSGGVDYVTKPIDNDQLLYRIKIYIRFIELERSINKMLEQKVQERTAELNEKNRQLREEIEKRRTMERERKEIEAKAFTQSKLASLGEMAAGVAHEVFQPLNFIKGVLQYSLWNFATGDFEVDEVREDFNRAICRIDQISQIISHLKTFGRENPLETKAVKINVIVQEALLLMTEKLRLRSIKLHNQIPPDLPEINANPVQLEQVFINLFQNAIDAIESQKGGAIEINAEHSQNNIVITFQDDGPGIPEDIQDRVFEPFFTTKEVGKGTGLGLSIIYGIVKKHDGEIECQSKPGKGTRFTIKLPRNPTSDPT